jgi:group I intron endonuclease
MKTKDKPGVENWKKLAVCKIDGNELKYTEGSVNMGLKQYLTKLGIKFENCLDYYDIIDNPYKDVPRCYCKICNKVFKDATNKSGMLTGHITNHHKTEIKDYLEQYPSEKHLFNTQLLILNRQKELAESPDNRIQCPICMKYFKAIRNTHIQKHGMTMEEFREVTGMGEILSKKTKEISREVYYSENGLVNYKKPKTKPPVVKKEKDQFSKKKELKVFKEGVDYFTYDYDSLLKEGRHFIYKITSPSGKCYIGRTVNFYHRMSQHKKVSERSATVGLYHAVQKYGWDNMKAEVIDLADDKSEAIKKELRWINFFDSFKNGYNRTLKTQGGGSPIDQDDEPEAYAAYIKKLSDSMKGRVANNKGIPMSPESKKLMKEKAKGRYTLEWFIERNGEELGKQKYQERVGKLTSRTDQARDEKGTFIKRT